MSKLKELISEHLEQDNDFTISSKVVKALSQVEIKYLLDNLISPDDLFIITKVQESLVSLEDRCQYCRSIKRIPHETCCASKEIQAYLSRCEDYKLVKQFGSSSEDVKRIRETERRLQEKKSSLSLSKFHELLQRKNEGLAGRGFFKAGDFEGHRGILLRIRKKLENIRRFFPELYSKNQSIIDIWAGSSCYDHESKDT